MKHIIKTILLAGVPFGITMSLFTSILGGIYNGIFAGTITGFFFGLIISIFVLIQSKKFRKLNDMDSIVFDGGANHFKGSESVGGWLYLTSNDLYFKSHSINIQAHEIKIPLDQIETVEPASTLLLVPNGLNIILKNSSIEKFVVSERKNWIKEIRNTISNL